MASMRLALALALAMLAAAPGARGTSPGELLDAEPPGAGDASAKYLVVDCLLPPQMVRQGERAVRMLPSRPAKLSARQCAKQGGAQTTGLGAWKRLADAGNAEAQTYLGEMFENGLGGAPIDVEKAIELYTRASNAGNARAASNLALLYANGAPGLPRNLQKAEGFVRQAAVAVGVDTRNIEVMPVASGRPMLPAPSVAGLDLKQFPFGRYHALLIGNGDYANAPALRSPVHEVDAIGKLLEQKYGFRVVKLKNATRDHILKKLDDLDMELKESDNLLVYYTGHGAESAAKEGYWIPVDGENPASVNKNRTRLWVSSSELREKLSVMAPKHVLVVADSCYSARFLQFRGAFSSAAGLPPAAYLDNFGKLYAAKSRTALTSGGLAPVIEPNDGSNMSLFAKAFVQFLERNRDPVPSVQIFSGIAMDVLNGTSRLGFAQQPQWGPITGAGHESGDFWFRPTK